MNIKSVNGRVKVCKISIRNKTSQIRSPIKANDFNLIVLTKTWNKYDADDDFYL